jgi:hypothetical protein
MHTRSPRIEYDEDMADEPPIRRQSAVRSRPLPGTRMQRVDHVAIRAGAVALALPLWVAGAKYTLDGAIRAINMLLAWLSSSIDVAPVALPPITSLVLYVVLAGCLGALFSRIELGQWHSVRQRRWRQMGTAALIVWAVANGLDVGSTFIGVTAQGQANLPLQAWVATNLPAAAIWSIIVTYLPETLLVFAFRRK